MLGRIDGGEFTCIARFATRNAQYSGHPLRQAPFGGDDTMRLQSTILPNLSVNYVDAFDCGVQRVRILSEGRLDHGIPRMTGGGHIDEREMWLLEFSNSKGLRI